MPSWYPSRVKQNYARFIQRHIEAVSLFCSVYVVYPVAEKGACFEVYKTRVNENMVEVRVYYPLSSFKWLKMFRMVYAAWKGYRTIWKEYGKPDIIHLSVIYPAGFAALLLSYIAKLPLVIDEHWTGYRKLDGSFRGAAMKLLANICTKKSSAIITESDSMGEAMRQHGLRGKYFSIPNAVDDFGITANINRKTGRFVFVHASTFDNRQKNITGLLSAVQKLSLIRQDFKLIMVGGVHGAEAFIEIAKGLKIQDYVSFPGFIDRQSLRQKMANAGAFILFSNYEGLPCVVLEAMSTGTPVICTEIGGMSEWVTPDTGILIDIGDEGGLVKAMNWMIDHHHEFDKEKISRSIWERCSYGVVGRKFFDVYEKVLND